MKPLFNGHNLRGWVPVNVAPSTFSVRDGMIITTGKPMGVMRTSRMYENFILELDWKHIVKGGNSGLFVWADAITAQGAPFTRAIEVQVLDGDDPKGMWTGQGDLFSIHGATCVPDRPHPGGWMRCLPSERRAHPAGEWNHYRVECRDGRITLAVNGKVVSGLSQCSQHKGYICLESEGSECHFKNLMIQELPSSHPPASKIALADEGFKSIYNGLDLSGWQAVDNLGRKVDSNPWMVRDWMLASEGEGILQTKRRYSSFELIADFRYLGTVPSSLSGQSDFPVRLGDATIHLPHALLKPDRWYRMRIRIDHDSRSVYLDDKTLETATHLDLPNEMSISLVCVDAPIEFTNLYVKPL